MELDDDGYGVTRYESGKECIQVVVMEAAQPALDQWLASRGLELFSIPYNVENDLPTFGIRPTHMFR